MALEAHCQSSRERDTFLAASGDGATSALSTLVQDNAEGFQRRLVGDVRDYIRFNSKLVFRATLNVYVRAMLLIQEAVIREVSLIL